MSKRISAAFCAAFLSLAGHAAESPQVTQVFGCNLKDGATMDDFWSGAEFFRGQLGKIDSAALDELSVFVWTPFRATADYDFIWGVNSANLNSLGQGLADYYASEAGQAADARFATFSDCDAGVVFSETIQEGPEAAFRPYDREADAVVEVFACTYRAGKGKADFDDAVAFWKQQVANIGDASLTEGYGAYVWTPYRGTNAADVYWVGTSSDIRTWATGGSAYVTSAAGQAADARFDAITECSSGLWSGYWVVQPEE